MSPGVLIIILIVFLIFLTSFFLSMNLSQPNTNTGNTAQTVAFPTLNPETKAGMQAMGITPLPSSFSTSMCQLQTNDIILVIDNSGSMKGNKLVEAKEAAKIFIDLISINPASRLGVVTFDKTSQVVSPLSSDYIAVKEKIDQIKEKSSTCIQCGVLTANEQIAAHLRDNVKRSAVLLSDGKGNHVNGQRSNIANVAALDEIQKGFKTNGISYYTIAIGKDADERFMQQSASTTQGISYSANALTGLSQAFANVATDICT
jgi:Mg-chelatase subunit ChlD